MYLMTAFSRAGYQMVNVAHRCQRRRDAGCPEHGQTASLLSRERRSTAPIEFNLGYIGRVSAQTTEECRAEHRAQFVVKFVI